MRRKKGKDIGRRRRKGRRRRRRRRRRSRGKERRVVARGAGLSSTPRAAGDLRTPS